MAKEPSDGALLNLLLGLWLGGSIVVWGVVGYNFAGIPRILDNHPELANRSGLDPGDSEYTDKVKTSVIWVYSSELNRAYFTYWGFAQLGLALAALLAAIRGRHGVFLTGLVIAAGALAAYSYFWQIPEIITVGTSLDFVPRDPPPSQLETFHRLHKSSLFTDFGRGALIILATILCIMRTRRASKAFLEASSHS